MPYFEGAQSPDLRCANLTDVHGNQYNVNNIYSTDPEARALAALKPAIRGTYHVSRCMEGTRESVFREIDDWLDNFGVPMSIDPCLTDVLTSVPSRDPT